MNTQIKKIICSKFNDLRLLFADFFDIPESQYYEGFEFKAEIDYEEKVSAIERYWNIQVLPLIMEINNSNNIDNIRFMVAEFDSVYQYLTSNYYGLDYRSHFKVGKDITSKEFELLSDNEKEWHLEAEPFLRQKKYLYELLYTGKQQVEYPDSLIVPKSTTVQQNKGVSTFDDIFKSADWSPYIDALVHVQILDSDYNFVGNPNKHKGIIASWFYTLQNDLKVIKASVSRSMLMVVVNNELPNLEIKSDKIFEKPMKSYDNRYRKLLENYIENIPIVPNP